MTMNHTYIQNFSNFNTVEGCYIISNIRLGMTRSGKPYLNATLSDASGSIGMVCWEVDGSVTPALNDQIVEVCGSWEPTARRRSSAQSSLLRPISAVSTPMTWPRSYPARRSTRTPARSTLLRS